MNDSIAGLGATPDSTYGQGSPSRNPEELAEKDGHEPATPEAPALADMRLIIEDGQGVGALVYKTVDGRTGEVIRQLPREQVLRLRDAKVYVAGQVIKTRA